MNTLRFNFYRWCLALAVVIFGAQFSAADDQRPITIGVLENRGFDFAEMMKRSFSLAGEAIDDRGGIGGRRLRLVFADDGGKKRKGLEAVRWLVRRKGAVVLTGGYSSTNTLAMAHEADHLDVPLLVCTAADDRITQHGRVNVFRLNPPAAEYAIGLQAMIEKRLKPKSMAIIYENSPFGTGGATQMMWFCRQHDIAIRDIIPYHRERAAADYFDRLLAPLTANPPESIYLVSYKTDGVLMVQRIRAAGIQAHLMGGAGGFTHPDFIEEAGGASDFMTIATLWAEDLEHPAARDYAQRYRARYQETPDYHGAEAYSALLVIADALERAESMAAKDIRAALGRTRMQTPFGKVVFESYGHYERQNRQSTMVLQVQGGGYACVWPPDLSVANLVLPGLSPSTPAGIREAVK